MADLDLTAAIKAATAALDGMELHPRIGINPDGFVLDLPRADIATTAITAAAPLIAARVAERIAQAITDNVRHPDFSKQDRGEWHGFAERMAYVAGHDKAAAIAREHGTAGGTA